MIEQPKRTQEQYVAEKLKDIKEQTGLDVSRAALDWARKTDGLIDLNEGETAAATVAFHEYLAKNGESATAKDLGSYVKLRQKLEHRNASTYRQHRSRAPS